MNGAILQQVFVVEFVIQSQMCDDCHRVEAKDFWKAVVQVRQKVGVAGLLVVKCVSFYGPHIDKFEEKFSSRTQHDMAGVGQGIKSTLCQSQVSFSTTVLQPPEWIASTNINCQFEQIVC